MILEAYSYRFASSGKKIGGYVKSNIRGSLKSLLAVVSHKYYILFE